MQCDQILIGIQFIYIYIFEPITARIIRMINGEVTSRANVDVIIIDSINLISCLHSCSICFIPCTCNRVIHEIAKYAPSIEHSITWPGDFPSWVQRVALLDACLS